MFELLEKHRVLSRPEISRRLGVSKPTVSRVTDYLYKNNFIREGGLNESSGGRKPMLYNFNPDKGYVIGIDVGATNARAIITNLYGETLATVRENTKTASSAALAQQLADFCSGLQAQVAYPDRLLATAIGIPGVADPLHRSVHYAPNLTVLEAPTFFGAVEELLKGLIAFHNDVNLAALGERSSGAGQHVGTFAFVNIGSGLGLAIIEQGVLVTGHLGRAGEFGYTRVSLQEERTIEDFVSGYGLADLHRGVGGSGIPRDAFDEASQEIEPGASVIPVFLNYLAWLLTAISNMLDPELIILGGSLGLRCEPYLAEIRTQIERQTPIVPTLAISELADGAGLAGAVAAALTLGRTQLLAELGGPS